jgi:iron complex outermembrane receptor protein
MYTEDGPEHKPFFEVGTIGGSFNYRKSQVKAGGQTDKLNYFLSLSRLKLDGYRDHSKTKNILMNSKFRYEIDNSTDVTLTVNILNSPDAQDPGGLTKQPNSFNNSISSPEKAQKNNLKFNSGESVMQQQLGILYNQSVGETHSFSLRNYYILRDFKANLPFGDFTGKGTTPSGGVIELDRFFVGGGGHYSFTDQLFKYKNKLTLGFDVDQQRDKRVNFTNIIESNSVGPRSLDQDENILNWGVYFQNELIITDSFQLNFGARYDEVNFDFIDNYFDDNTDNSGEISFSALSPSIGAIWNSSKLTSIYSNINTSFETPSTREFANPTSAGGFNAQLDEQRSINYEVGVRGQISPRFSYDFAAFLIESKNELTLAGENPAGSSFFANTGKTLRNGLELSLKATPLNNLDLSLAYTYSNFKFVNFPDESGASFKGNSIPGIPTHTAFAELSYSAPSGLYLSWNTQFVDKIHVDNANSDTANSYTTSNLRAGKIFYTQQNELNIFFGLNNIFDRSYIGAVRVNEANNRFFEPAPKLNTYIGLSLRYN